MNRPEFQRFLDGARVRFTDEARKAMRGRPGVTRPLRTPAGGPDAVYTVDNTDDALMTTPARARRIRSYRPRHRRPDPRPRAVRILEHPLVAGSFVSLSFWVTVLLYLELALITLL